MSKRGYNLALQGKRVEVGEKRKATAAEVHFASLVAEIEHFGGNLNAHIEKISAAAKAEKDELKKANLEGHVAAWRVVAMELRAVLKRAKRPARGVR